MIQRSAMGIFMLGVKITMYIAIFVYVLHMIVTCLELFSWKMDLLRKGIVQDGWIKSKCNEPDFAVHVSHINLCEQVFLRADRNIHLTALEETLNEIKLCGSRSCEDLFYLFCGQLQMTWGTLLFVVGLIFLFILKILIPMCKSLMREEIRQATERGALTTVRTIPNYAISHGMNMNQGKLLQRVQIYGGEIEP